MGETAADGAAEDAGAAGVGVVGALPAGPAGELTGVVEADRRRGVDVAEGTAKAFSLAFSS